MGSSFLDEVPYQTMKGRGSLMHSLIHRIGKVLIQISQALGQMEAVADLRQRGDSNTGVSEADRRGPRCEAFDDVRGDGVCSSSHLRRQFVSFGGWEFCSRQPMNFDTEIISALPRNQLLMRL